MAACIHWAVDDARREKWMPAIDLFRVDDKSKPWSINIFSICLFCVCIFWGLLYIFFYKSLFIICKFVDVKNSLGNTFWIFEHETDV